MLLYPWEPLREEGWPLRSKYFGDRAFYKRLLTVAGPILIQNIITNFVNLLDNIMVGQIGTESMSGVAIVNQLVFVFNLCVLGGIAGPGIFTAQFCGKGDDEGVRSSIRAKFYIVAAALVAFGAAFLLRGDALISLFLHEGGDGLDLAATLVHGRAYLRIIVPQMVPFALMQIYSSSLRETGETMLPMKAGVVAVVVNFVLNYILIFGKLGLPALGVTGAAIATLAARCVEAVVVIGWSHRHPERAPFVTGLYRTMRVPGRLLKQIAILGAPLLANEVLWSAGMTMLNQCYSVRGLTAVSAGNIASTVTTLFFCGYFAVGTAISILIGQYLGAGELERAVDEDRKLIFNAVLLSVAIAAAMALAAPLIPRLYNTTDAVKQLATAMLFINAVIMPIEAFGASAYFTLRAGGKTFITFLFDSGFTWVFSVPLAFVLSRYTDIPIVTMFAVVQSLNLLKSFLGWLFLRSRTWVNNLVKD